jgi:hypothetical protein
LVRRRYQRRFVLFIVGLVYLSSRWLFCSSPIIIIVHNVTEAVKARVSKKLERAVMIPNAVKNQAAQQAGQLTSPKYVTHILAQTLCKKVPENLQKQGVTVQMDEVFREHTYVVLQLNIKHVNPLTMISSAWTETSLSWLLDSMGASNRKKVEEGYREFSRKIIFKYCAFRLTSWLK